MSPDIDAFRHALLWLKENEGYEPEIVVHLRPPGPVRRVEHIDEVVALQAAHPEADAVRSVRRALQKDIERLKNLPFIDTSGLAIRLDTVIAGIDTLPLVFDERLPAQRSAPAAASTAPAATGATSTIAASSTTAAAKAEPSAWRRLRDDAWEQFKQLVRIRDIGDADPVLLNPSQTYFVRENLKLKLLNARIALLQRNEALFKSDIDGAIVWLNRYADVRSKTGGNALASLRSLSSSAVAIELPTLAESLNAVRNYKTPQRPAAPPVAGK